MAGQWRTFDPGNSERREGQIFIGRGRGASDVAMATTLGGRTLESMIVESHEVTGGA